MGNSIKKYNFLKEEVATGNQWIALEPVVLTNVMELEIRSKPLSCYLGLLGMIAEKHDLNLNTRLGFSTAREKLVRQALWN
jgi:hypothetical protein